MELVKFIYLFLVSDSGEVLYQILDMLFTVTCVLDCTLHQSSYQHCEPARDQERPTSSSFWFGKTTCQQATELVKRSTQRLRSCTYMHIHAHTSRRGENRASVLSVFCKNVVFAIAKLLMISSNLYKFSRGKSKGFDLFSCNLQGILS